MTQKYVKRLQNGGTNLILPFYRYIPLDDTIRTVFESVICGIEAVSINTDLLTVCGLDTKDQVWFGYQYMDSTFYDTHMNKVGYTHTETSILRKHTLNTFSQQDTKVGEVTEKSITITAVFHNLLKTISELQIPWKVIYQGKELYKMIVIYIVMGHHSCFQLFLITFQP